MAYKIHTTLISNITDQLGRPLNFLKPPRRIISLVPSQTELLVDLGLEERIVGITKFCVHPGHLREEKTIVGGTKKVNFEKIKALRPDIIFCNKEENTQEMVLRLEEIAPVHVSEIADIEATLELTDQYGKIFQVEPEANRLKAEISEAQLHFQEHVRDLPVIKVAYFIWKDPWMVAGRDTFINYLLLQNKFQNVFAKEEGRYPEVSLQSLKEKGVELILLSSEPFPFREEHKEEFRRWVGCPLKLVNGEFFSWYGSRLTAAFYYFSSLRAT